ncbi:MAG: hypothetical protein JWM72_921, partial [Actinomycetia bacterium]|nr:hypothetical protein [Actinomycetes bacterium]
MARQPVIERVSNSSLVTDPFRSDDSGDA